MLARIDKLERRIEQVNSRTTWIMLDHNRVTWRPIGGRRPANSRLFPSIDLALDFVEWQFSERAKVGQVLGLATCWDVREIGANCPPGDPKDSELHSIAVGMMDLSQWDGETSLAETFLEFWRQSNPILFTILGRWGEEFDQVVGLSGAELKEWVRMKLGIAGEVAEPVKSVPAPVKSAPAPEVNPDLSEEVRQLLAWDKGYRRH